MPTTRLWIISSSTVGGLRGCGIKVWAGGVFPDARICLLKVGLEAGRVFVLGRSIGELGVVVICGSLDHLGS